MKIRSERQSDKQKEPPRRKLPWAFRVFLITFAVACTISIVAETSITGASMPIVIVVLLLLVSIGILFDAVGTAVTACTEPPLMSMAAKRVKGAKYALYMVRNADRVSNICNDVVGDICGIISGTAAAALSLKLSAGFPGPWPIVISTVVAGLTSAITVGGKAAGKHFALSHSREILLFIGRIVCFFHK